MLRAILRSTVRFARTRSFHLSPILFFYDPIISILVDLISNNLSQIGGNVATCCLVDLLRTRAREIAFFQIYDRSGTVHL